MRHMKRKWIVIAPVAVLAILLFSAIGGVIVMQLWNWLLPAIFDVRQITFWQALGILVLCRILFGGRGGHRGSRFNLRRRMEERWERMTPEERERFRQGIRDRWGFRQPSENKGQ